MSGCFVRQGTKVGSTEECGQIISIPRRVKQDATILSPSGVDSPSILKRHNIPRQVLKLIPSRFWKLVPCRIRTSLPSFIQSYSSQGLITGLSSANCHGRSPSANFFQSPAGVLPLLFPKQSLSSSKSSTGLPSKLRQSISSTEHFSGRSSRIYFPKTKIHS